VTGTLGHWDTGTLGHWDTGTLGHWDTGYLRHWDTGTLGQWDNGTLGHWGTGYLRHWDTGTLGHWDTGTPENSRNPCKTWSLHGGDYDECRLQGCDVVWLLWEPTFRRTYHLIITVERISELGRALTSNWSTLRRNNTFLRNVGSYMSHVALDLTRWHTSRNLNTFPWQKVLPPWIPLYCLLLSPSQHKATLYLL
jgi:hypothetical protein